MTNNEYMAEAVANCPDPSKMPRELWDWMWRNYRYIDHENMTDEEKSLNWEVACCEGNDWKYGRNMICREKKLIRGLSFHEFYGGGIVD